MANFFDGITGEAITALEVKKGSKFKLGLYGGGPAPKYERLNVTTAIVPGPNPKLNEKDPAVTFVKEIAKGSSRFLYEVNSARMQGPVVRACYNGDDYSEAVDVVFEDVDDIRTSIVDLAREFVDESHYLWGTAGNRPNWGDGNPGGGKTMAARMRDYSLDPKATAREKVLAVCMAVQNRFDGYNTCAGRSRMYAAEKPDLDAFLKSCQDAIDKGITDQTEWTGAGSKKNLFPRKYHFRGALKNSGKVVWGESCDDVHHFDCVGLVNYCYAKHWYQTGFGLSISQYRNANQGTSPVTKDKDRKDADILIKPSNGHIAMLCSIGDDWYVVQASDTDIGLNDDHPYRPSDWDRYRMNAAYLVPRHV